jgi:competence protein ComEC
MRSNIIAFVFGVWFLQQQPVLPDSAWTYVLLVLPGALAFTVPRGTAGSVLLRQVLWKFSFTAAGFLWAAFIANGRLSDTLPKEWEGRDVTLVGVVAELPQASSSGQRFRFDVESVQTAGARVPRRILLTWPNRGDGADGATGADAVRAGERWQLTARLKRPHGTTNRYGFDYEGWLLEHNVRATGFVKPVGTRQRLAEMVWQPGYMVERAREIISGRLDVVLRGKSYGGVLKALTIGDQSAIPRDQWQTFLRTGVNHLVSISGLHVTMISGLAFSLVFWAWRRRHGWVERLPARKAATLAALFVALCYALLAGFAIPAQRTFFMLAVIGVALWSGRVAASSVTLCLALFVVVLMDPWAVLAPGFWLSFGAVAVIMYVTGGRLGKVHWLRSAAHIQSAVTLGLIPAMLLLFQQVSIISPLANAFAIPVVSLVVVPLALAGALLPFDFLLLAAHHVMAWCVWALDYLAGVPVAVWAQHAPPAWAAGLALIAIMWLLLPRGFPSRWIGLPALLPIFMVVPAGPQSGQLWLTVLDIGQGTSVLVRTAHHALLYDTGPPMGREADSGTRVILPYLRGAGIRSLDGLVVSHNDADHSGGAASVLAGIDVGWLASSLPGDSPIPKGASHSMRCFAGQSWTWDDVRFEMLHPSPESYDDDRIRDNDRSCVLKVSSVYGSAMLPADAELRSEREMIERLPDKLPSTVLLVPHHGSRTSSSPDYIRMVNPAVAIFTVGYRNRYGHPKPDVARRYDEAGSRSFRTDETGEIDLRFETADGVLVEPYRIMHHRYWWE